MLDRLLPAPVRSAELFGDVPAQPCFPGEEDLVAAASPGRRHEVITARACARQALVALGHPPVAIGRGPKREPLWPPGLTGSITHCPGYRAAAVARLGDVASLGIDAEPHEPLPPRVGGTVIAPGEAGMLAALAARRPDVHWDRLLFSAKESIYKSWFPRAGRWLGFEDAVVEFDPDGGVFTARILIDGPFREVHGRYLVERGFMVTTVRT